MNLKFRVCLFVEFNFFNRCIIDEKNYVSSPDNIIPQNNVDNFANIKPNLNNFPINQSITSNNMNRNNVPTGYDQPNLLQNNQSFKDTKFMTNVPPTSSNFGFVQNNNFPDVANNNMTKSIGIPNNIPPYNSSNVSFNPNSVFNSKPNASTFTKNISPSFDSLNYNAPVQVQQEVKPIPVITKTRDKKKDPEFIMKLEKTKDFCKKATGELDYKRVKQAKDNIIEALKLIEELEKYDI